MREGGGVRMAAAGGGCDAPRFLISIISANDQIKRVKHVDDGQTLVNLGHHLENLVNNH
jgi:hypothetical protein